MVSRPAVPGHPGGESTGGSTRPILGQGRKLCKGIDFGPKARCLPPGAMFARVCRFLSGVSQITKAYRPEDMETSRARFAGP